MISGLQKMTLLDYPGKVACTVFLQGCNFRCPFCHNSDLLPRQGEPFMTEDALIAFLEKRTGLLDGVCITGGEPTLQPGLADLLRRIKALGFAVKLDTNGSRPQVLKQLVEAGLVDYVAMDVKNCPSRYAQTIGSDADCTEAMEKSLGILLQGNIPFELRTTVVKPLHDAAALAEMGRWLYALNGDKKVPVLYLQPFEDRETVLFSGMQTPDADELARLADALTPFVANVHIRSR